MYNLVFKYIFRIHMHRIQCMRLFICIVCLHLTQGCSETQTEGATYIDLIWDSCDSGENRVTLYKNTQLHDGREYFEGITETYQEIYMFWTTNSYWGISTTLDGAFTGPRRFSNSDTLPVGQTWWGYCGTSYVHNTNLKISRSNCYECGRNKITPPDSNICQCRAGQFASSAIFNSNCEDCPTNTYKDSPSNEDCTSCGNDRTSLAGSTDVSACLCIAGAGVTHEGIGPCTPCPSGTYKEDNTNTDCIACQENSSSAMGSSAITAC